MWFKVKESKVYNKAMVDGYERDKREAKAKRLKKAKEHAEWVRDCLAIEKGRWFS